MIRFFFFLIPILGCSLIKKPHQLQVEVGKNIALDAKKMMLEFIDKSDTATFFKDCMGHDFQSRKRWLTSEIAEFGDFKHLVKELEDVKKSTVNRTDKDTIYITLSHTSSAFDPESGYRVQYFIYNFDDEIGTLGTDYDRIGFERRKVSRKQFLNEQMEEIESEGDCFFAFIFTFKLTYDYHLFDFKCIEWRKQ